MHNMKLLRDKIKRDTYMCSKVCNMIARGDLRDDHPQQRKSGQWSRETRDNFIVTVIKNEDFDPIKICEQLTDEGVVLWLIDGLQRSTTIENFKSGVFALGRNIDPYIVEYQESEKDSNGNITYKNISYDLRGKAYKDLPEKLKEDFDNCPVDVVKHLDCSDEEVGRHIVRYNSGRAMVAAQKISAYMYNTAKFVKRLSGHAFFNDCANYSEAKDKNGEIDKVVCETIMGLNFFDSWNKNAQKIGRFLNENATEKMFEKFNSYLDRLLEVVTPETGKLFSTKNAMIWFMLFDKFNKSGLSDDKFQLFLENYDTLKKIKVEVTNEYEIKKGSGERINVVSFAELDACKSTKDKGVILDKLHILETVMNGFLHISEVANREVDDTQISILDFVKKNVDSEVTEEDIEDYKQFYEDELKLEVDNSSELLDESNNNSMLAIIAYVMNSNITLNVFKKWLVDFFNKNHTYNHNQKENYMYMKNSLQAMIAA